MRGTRVALGAGVLLFRLVPLLVVLLWTVPSLALHDAGPPQQQPLADAEALLDDTDCDAAPSCPVFDDAELAALAEPEARDYGKLLYFWGVGCPHCKASKPFVQRLPKEYEGLEVEWVEVRKDKAGRKRFLEVVRRLKISAPGIPTFVHGTSYVVGYDGRATETRVRRMISGEKAADQSAGGVERFGPVELPLFGAVDPASVSLPTFTLMVGLVDGINPCAIWVLLVLLGILMHVRSRTRLLLFGGTFVLVSGVVYFLFMTVWVELFELVGLSRSITIGLGVVVLLMGIVNLKELVWFKKGVSLTIPDKAKPSLYRRMRAIASAASLPAAMVGIAVLAFVVNLIELGCTLGLPAIYTRILTLQPDLSTPARYGYLALYNLAYVVPLAVIVGTYALTLHRVALGERGARALKAVSGTLLVGFGTLFIAAPDVLR